MGIIASFRNLTVADGRALGTSSVLRGISHDSTIPYELSDLDYRPLPKSVQGAQEQDLGRTLQSVPLPSQVRYSTPGQFARRPTAVPASGSQTPEALWSASLADHRKRLGNRSLAMVRTSQSGSRFMAPLDPPAFSDLRGRRKTAAGHQRQYPRSDFVPQACHTQTPHLWTHQTGDAPQASNPHQDRTLGRDASGLCRSRYRLALGALC